MLLFFKISIVLRKNDKGLKKMKPGLICFVIFSIVSFMLFCSPEKGNHDFNSQGISENHVKCM